MHWQFSDESGEPSLSCDISITSEVQAHDSTESSEIEVRESSFELALEDVEANKHCVTEWAGMISIVLHPTYQVNPLRLYTLFLTISIDSSRIYPLKQ